MFQAKLRHLLGCLLSFVLLFSSIQPIFAAASFSDLNGNWAEQQMIEWIQKGWIQGYPDGTIRPNAPVTRVEYMALINRAFDFQEKGSVQFNDTSAGNWQYDVISRAVKAGYVNGYADGSIHPSAKISRQEAAVMLTRNLNLEPVKLQSALFKDASRIADWSLDAVSTLVANKLLSGYADSTFHPEQSITRAEAVVLIGRGLHARSVVYSKSGIYGPDKEIINVIGNVVINVTNVTLKNMTIEGNLLFADGIGSGDAFLKTVTVRGKTTINGGGSHSIHLEDSTLESITVNKKDGDVRVVAEGTTTSKEVKVESSALIEQSNATKGGFSSIKLSDQLPLDSKIALKGSFENVDVDGKQISLDISGGTIGKLNVADKATGTSINIDKESKIVELKLDAEVKTTGDGKIEKANVSEQAKNSSLSTKPDLVDGKGATDIKIISPKPVPTPEPTGPVVFFPPGGGGNTGNSGNSDAAAPVNHVPTGSVPIQQFLSGTSPKVIHLASFITDSDSDPITYSNVVVANTTIANVQLSNSDLTVTEVGTGSTTISFSYTDGKETPVSASFKLNINASITGVSAINSTIIEVTLNHPNLHVDLSQFTVTDAAGNSKALESANLAPYDRQSQTVILKLSSDTTAGSLYKVKSSSSSFDFVGIPVDITKPTITSVVASTYHEVVVTFSEPIVLDNPKLAIHQKYGGKSLVNINGVGIMAKNKIKLYTNYLTTGALYELNLSDVADYAQQAIDPVPVTFAGIGLSQTNINSIAKVLSGNRVYIDLAAKYDPAQLRFADITVNKGNQYFTPVSVSAATYQDAFDYGYLNLPASDVQAASEKGIIVTIGDSLINGAIYTVSIAMLAGGSGDFYTASTIFAGIYTATMPTVQAGIAVDAQTLKIFFDRAVDDITIDGVNKLYNSSIAYSSTGGSAYVIAGRTNLIANGFVVQTKLGDIDLSSIPGSYAYKDPADGHVLVVNVPTANFFKGTNAAPTPGTFKLIVDSNKVVSTASANISEFAPNANDPSTVSVNNVMATNSNKIRVYFSKAVQFGTMNDFAQIATVSGHVYGNGANITITNPIATDSTLREYEFNVTVPFTDTSQRYLVFNPSLDLTDFSDLGHIVGLNPNQSNVIFTGYPGATGPIANVSVASVDKKTLLIYYPEAMMNSNLMGNSGDTLTKANYELYNTSSGGSVMLDSLTQTSWFQTHVVDSKMDMTTNRVTFTFDQALNPGTIYYLQFAPTLANTLNNKTVKNLDNSPLRTAFVMYNSAAAKVTVSSATYASGVITIKLNQKVKSSTNMNLNQANLLKEFGIALIGSNYTMGTATNDALANTAITTSVAFNSAGSDTITITLSNAVQTILGSIQLIKVGIVTGTNDFIGINGETCDTSDIFIQI